MTTDHYPEHVKKVEELIASGEAGKKVAKDIAEDRKVTLKLTQTCTCTYHHSHRQRFRQMDKTYLTANTCIHKCI